MQVRSASEAAALAKSPVATDLLGDVLLVDLDRSDGVDLSPLRSLPRVVVGMGAGEVGQVDIVVAEPRDAVPILEAVGANPIAATALVMHLRASEGLDMAAGLIAESAAYSMLQAGPEHEAWLASRTSRQTAADLGDERVRLERVGPVLRITLARPEVRNAVDAAMQQALMDAFACADESDEVVVTGDGPCFSSGGDLGEFGARADPASAHLLRISRSPARALARVAAQTTVYVHGACYGAGVELPAFAHRVVAREDTTFTLPEVGLGLIPGAGGTVSIPHRIGRQRTAWLGVTGETIDAETALSWGLVDEIGAAGGRSGQV